MKRVTIKDIAAYLRLSVSTVSRALADDKNIRQETRNKVFAAADELGYKRNVIAANLRRGKSNTIAVVVNQMITPFASRVIAGIQKYCNEHHIYMVTCNSDNSPEMELETLTMIEHSLMDGIIAIPCGSKNREKYEFMSHHDVPLVFIMLPSTDPESSCMVVNYYDKAFFLFDHIIQEGKRNIAFVRYPFISRDKDPFVKAYVDSLKKFKIPYNEDLIIDGGITQKDGVEIADKLLESGKNIDAFVSFNELVAIGIMNRVHNKGFRIPEEIAIAAFFGSELSTLVYPSLTTLELPLEDMGYKASELLLKKVENPEFKPEKVIMDAPIAIRASTRQPKPAM